MNEAKDSAGNTIRVGDTLRSTQSLPGHGAVAVLCVSDDGVVGLGGVHTPPDDVARLNPGSMANSFWVLDKIGGSG